MNNKDYLDLLESVQGRSKDLEIEEVSGFFEFSRYLPQALNFFHVPFYVLDYTKRDYKIFTCVEQISLGYHANAILEGGVAFAIERYHKDDFAVINEKVFGQTIKILANAPQNEHLQYLFTYNYRLRNKAGGYSTIYQQSKYITDKGTRLPIYTFGTTIDITHLKTNDNIIYRVDRHRQNGNLPCSENIINSVYFPCPEDALLTKREREILGWLSEGLSTKQIAKKLYICEHTLATHRKNMLRKTDSNNVAQLIKYGIKNGII